MSADRKACEGSRSVQVKIQHGAHELEFIPKNDTTSTPEEVRENVHAILMQMYIRSRTQVKKGQPKGDFADAA